MFFVWQILPAVLEKLLFLCLSVSSLKKKTKPGLQLAPSILVKNE